MRDEIAAKRPAAVIITGDHTMRARHHEFAAATRWITALDVPVTISIGVNTWRPGQGVDDRLMGADRALLDATREGRNRVTMAGEFD